MKEATKKEKRGTNRQKRKTKVRWRKKWKN